MSATQGYQPDPQLDLVLERILDVPRELVWAAWTQPEQLKKWFCPVPWSTTACDIDLRPGGIFRTVMRSPEGEEYPNVGCYLEVVENEKLVWTDALLPGYRPSPAPFFTGMLLLESQGTKTKYTAIAIHQNEEACRKHKEMGFHEGWSICADQLVKFIKQSRV